MVRCEEGAGGQERAGNVRAAHPIDDAEDVHSELMPRPALVEALRLYGEGYRPTSNKYRRAARPCPRAMKALRRERRNLGERLFMDFCRRTNRESVALAEDVFRELKELCGRFGS